MATGADLTLIAGGLALVVGSGELPPEAFRCDNCGFGFTFFEPPVRTNASFGLLR
jgi:hypothetical protein